MFHFSNFIRIVDRVYGQTLQVRTDNHHSLALMQCDSCNRSVFHVLQGAEQQIVRAPAALFGHTKIRGLEIDRVYLIEFGKLKNFITFEDLG